MFLEISGTHGFEHFWKFAYGGGSWAPEKIILELFGKSGYILDKCLFCDLLPFDIPKLLVSIWWTACWQIFISF